VLGNKITGKVHWGLVRLLERLAGGNGAVELGVARRGEEMAAFIGGLGSVVTTA
jgi:hypothetical protein